MNSLVSVDAEPQRELRRGVEGGGGGGEEEPQDDFEASPSLPLDGQGGNVVLVLPPKDSMMPHPSTSDDCIPLIVNNVPVFISHTSNGSPLYIRQYPPTLEEIMVRSPEDLIANFDGFSEASGQTFEGFSETSCNSVLFEGFSEEAANNPRFSVARNLGTIISEGTLTNDLDYWAEHKVPCESKLQRKSTLRSSRRSDSHKRKSTYGKDSPGGTKGSSASSSEMSPQKRAKQEGTAMKTEKEDRSGTSRNKHLPSQHLETIMSPRAARQSTDKQENEPDTSEELLGRKPRHMVSPEDPDYIGEHCNAVGCTVAFLERMSIKDVKVNNGIVQELSDFATRILWEKEFVVRWIQRLSGAKTEEPVEDDDLKSIQVVLKRRKALAIIHSGNQYVKSKIKSFDNAEFVLPSVAKKQGTNNEACSMAKPEASNASESATHTMSHPEINYEKEEVNRERAKEEVAVKKEATRREFRRRLKKIVDEEEVENKRVVKEKRTVRRANEKEESLANKVAEKKVAKGEVGEKEMVDRTSMINKQEKEEHITERNERKVSTRRASMVLAREEKEKQAIEKEKLGKSAEETNRDRGNHRRTSIVLKDEEEQGSGKIEEKQATPRKKKNQASNQEEDSKNKRHEKQPKDEEEHKQLVDRKKEKRTACIETDKTAEMEEGAEKTTEKETAGARGGMSTRRSSMILARQEKEKLDTVRGETAKQTTEKTETARNYNTRHSRGASITIRSQEDEQSNNQKREEQTAYKDREVDSSKTHERQAADNNGQVTRKEKEADRRGSDETTEKEKHTPVSDKQIVNETQTERRVSSRRASLIARQEKQKHVSEVEEAKQVTDRIVGEYKRERRVSSRRASLTMAMKQEEKKEDSDGEREKETASRADRETRRGRRASRRASLSIIEQDKHEGGKETTEAEQAKGAGNVQTEKLNSVRTKEVGGENLRASLEESKQTSEEEEEKSKTQYKYKEKQSRKKEQNGEKEEAPTSVEGEKDETKRSKELQIMGINDEDQVILKRNKVINRDKRISRWQNRKLGRHAEDNQDKIFSKDPLAIKSSPSSSEVREYMKSEQSSSWEDTQSDESDGNLVIDEGDSNTQSDSENNLMIDEGDTNVQDEPSHRMPKENKVSVAQSDGRLPVSVSEGKQKKKRKLTIEDSLPNKSTDSPQQRQIIRRKKEECEKATVGGETDTPESSVLAEEGEDSQKSHSSGIVEASPQGAAVHVSPEASPKTQGTESSFSSTLGISKSGRLRKASAKGIQSIEIKCLFMQKTSEASRPPPPLPVLKSERQDKDWMQEKRSPVKYDLKNKECMQEKKTSLSAKVRKLSVFKKTDTEHLSYTTREGHLVPTFKETHYYLGDFCFKAGVTVDDLNSDKEKEVKMTFGMIKELHDFYMSRKATKTALAVRLFKMNGKKFLDNTHLLSTVIRITNVGAMKYTNKDRLSKEFALPNRITYHECPEGEEVKIRQVQNLQGSEVPKTPPADDPPARRVRRTVKKRGFKPEDSGDEECCDYDGIKEDRESYNEILLTRGEKGSITRGDIVHLYSTWLKSKMSLGSNTFVTDLLRSVEQLMVERDIAPIRIPAGTLMSSSVKLHDEYEQILSISKEDAVMYLEEDWLEDIKYLLSISGPSRRSTTEGEVSLGGAGEGDNSAASEKYIKGKTGKRRSGGQKEEEVTDFEGEPLSNTAPFKGIHKKVDSVSHHMESVGKRLGKRRSIRESLQEYERDILLELEKVGVLEEEEEDILTQLEREKGMPKDEEVEGKKDVEREKGKDYDKDTQKKVTPNKKGMKPVADRNFDCEVDKILDYQEIHDNKGKHLRYLVRWVGSGSKGDSWVDEASLQCPEKLKAFWNRKKKTPRRDKPQPAVEKDCKSPREMRQSKPESLLKDPKDGEESIVQVMVKHGSAQHATNANKELPLVTKRELLNLYDIWRQENQDDLMAGGSNTVNVEVFKDRVRNLMAFRNVEFYPESLLNACFMMTLMKTRLQSKMSIDKFLDSSCMEVLESSHRQYLKGKYYQLGEAPSSKCPKEQKHSILSLQNELHGLRLDLTTAQKWRAVKNSQLGAVEEEVDCLKTAMNISNIKKKTKKILYFKQELQKLRSDIKILERNQRSDSNDKDGKKIKVPIFGEIIRDSEKYKRNRKIVRNKLLYMNISERAVNTIMNVVAQRVASELVQE